MNHSTRVALGVKDCHLELDEKRFTEPVELTHYAAHVVVSRCLKMALRPSMPLVPHFTINQQSGQ